jgi:serine/threonine protein kinase
VSERQPADQAALALQVDEVCLRFEKAWQSAQPRPRLEEFLATATAAARPSLLRELLALELAYRLRLGETPAAEEYERRFPGDGTAVRAVFAEVVSPARVVPPAPATIPEVRPAVGGTDGVPSPPLPVIAGYEVLAFLGEGGMGRVYKARQVRADRLVALKTIKAAGLTDDEGLRARFQTEARLAATLQHANIVQIFEVSEHDGQPFFSLELCAGGLNEKLADTPLPPGEAARLLEVLARAMQAAHEHGVIHRDLKPANVLLTADGTPKITDFGLAKQVGAVGPSLSGQVLGSPCYMAPEQARGNLKEVGPAADVYALGAILYERLTGRPPFKAATVAETLLQVLVDEPVPPRQLQPKTPRDLDTICLKCLHKEPARRYAGALDLADDLRRFTAGEPIRARPVGVGER